MKDLTQGSVTRHLVHMSAFLAMSMAVQTLYLLADLYWVGHLGKEAIAAVGVAGNITMIVLALTQMLGVGTTTLIAQAAGRKDQARAELVFNQSFVMSIVIAFALGIVGFLLRPAYCDWLSADATTATLAKAYLLWFLPGLLLQFPLVALGSALRATGIIKPAVGFQVLSVLLNIVLACSLADFWNRPVAQTRSDRRSACNVHFHPRRRRADDYLFRKEISLSAFSIPAF
jgi:Na+-driven multidrug efflux pump